MKPDKIISWLSIPKNLWLFVFVYTLLMGLLVQFVLLPYVFPGLHAGDGLLKGVDATKFHRIAGGLADQINRYGWDQWELFPSGQLVSGIAAVFYVLITPAPWTVLPLNALLNAVGSVSIYLVLLKITGKPSLSLIGAAPFLFFPSNLLWNTQFHNENYAVPGFALILVGWVTLLSGRAGQQKPRRDEFAALIAIGVGSAMVGLVRISILSGMTYLFSGVALAAALYWLFSKKKSANLSMLAFTVIASGLMFTVSTMLGRNPVLREDDVVANPRQTSLSTTRQKPSSWEESSWLPEPIDRQMESIARLRKKFIKAWDHAGSNIDTDVKFQNAGEVIAYLPRAAQIGFFSPFPNAWFTEGNKEAGKVMRTVSAFEMMLVYFSLGGVLPFLWRYRTHPAVWLTMFICTGMLMVYALTIPNLGALYRFRYPYLMPMVCFGTAGIVDLLYGLIRRAGKPQSA